DAAVPTTDLEFCVTETNRYRATVSKPALAHSAQLEAYANTGAMTDTLAASAHKHFSDTNGGGFAFAENECPSFLGWTVMGNVHDTIAACIAAFWSEGPGGGHYDNMTSNNTKLGCGVYLNGSGGITITQDYGN
ncbi:MAG: CAP domain-containing protein, partial [Proteobacteria bacterium]|nr:CAP domain-containing protein [Pseudomonadota bacterium]